MRALVLNNQLQLNREFPTPEPDAGEALIRVTQAGICTTDLEIVRGYMGFTGILGHEFVGIVEQALDRPDLVGHRVAGEINAACRQCETCQAGRPTHCPFRTVLGISGRDGAFADYLCLPFQNLTPLPPSLPDEQAVFIEPLAAACEITQQIRMKPTDRVVVIGDGKLGLLCAQVLFLTGCSLTLLGRHPEKGQWLQERGIPFTTSTSDIPPGVDLVVEATGHPDGFALAQQLVRPRGTIVLKSTYHGNLSLNMSKLVVDEISLIGSRCGPFSPAIRLLEQDLVQVGPLVQAQYSINDGLQAFEHAAKKGILKVLLHID
jgi:threonine dehydrogenase-like Zn-dependent dehydrogenase